MEYRAVCFDYDYTLADDTEAIVAGYCYGMECLGHCAPGEEAVRRQVGHTLEDGFTNLTGETDPARRKEFRRLYLVRAKPMQMKSTPLLPGARELLTGLRRRGVAAAIVSTKGTAVIEATIKRLGLSDTLRFVIGGDQVSAPKPDPQGLLEAVGRLGLAKEQVLYCGDTVIDAETARRAGVDFCGVLCGTTGPEAFAPYPSRYLAPDLFALAAWMGL